MEYSIKNAMLLQKIEKFIIVPEKINRLEEVLELDLTNIKGLNIDDAEKLKSVLGVSKIKDLANKTISNEDILFLKAIGIKSYRLSSWIIISRMIDEKKIDEFLGTQKILIIGLANAGKTALLHILQGNPNLEFISSLSPTKGVDRISLTKFDTTYQIWDMGGQETYRLGYIENAEKYFINISLIIYVIDVQDPNNFEKSLMYFKDILNVLETLNENPEFLFIIHKVDPDIKEADDVKENIQFLKSHINEFFQDKKNSYEIITYSIYNWFGESKGIYKEIRDYLTITPNEERQTIKFLSSTMEKILNMVINLSASLEQRLLNIEESIDNLRDWVKNTGKTTKKPQKLMAKKEIQKPAVMKDVEPLISRAREDLKALLKIRSKYEDV